MIALEPRHLKIVKDILHRYIPECRVVVFGSRVREKQKKFSDLDLCIMNTLALPDITLDNLREAFAESDLPIRVDIIEWARISPEFKEIVEQQNETI